MRAARQRGVLFDLGHGAGSFTFDVARKALAQDFPPDTISTDIYYVNVEKPVKDLPTTVSKFLNLGMSLEEAIARVTCNAARALREPQLGTLGPGSPADVTVLSLHEGSFSFVDCKEEVLWGPWKLEAAATIFAGKVIHQKGAT